MILTHNNSLLTNHEDMTTFGNYHLDCALADMEAYIKEKGMSSETVDDLTKVLSKAIGYSLPY